MTALERIRKARSAYRVQYGKDPTAVIVGYKVFEDFIMHTSDPHRLHGMTLIVDKDKADRAEAADFEIL